MANAEELRMIASQLEPLRKPVKRVAPNPDEYELIDLLKLQVRGMYEIAAGIAELNAKMADFLSQAAVVSQETALLLKKQAS